MQEEGVRDALRRVDVVWRWPNIGIFQKAFSRG